MEIARCFQSIQLRKSKSGDGAKEQSRQEHEDKGNSGGLLQLEDKRGKDAGRITFHIESKRKYCR